MPEVRVGIVWGEGSGSGRAAGGGADAAGASGVRDGGDGRRAARVAGDLGCGSGGGPGGGDCARPAGGGELTLLVPVVSAMVVMAEVQRALLATSAAAREAGRVYVTGPDRLAAERRAAQAYREVLGTYGMRA